MATNNLDNPVGLMTRVLFQLPHTFHVFFIPEDNYRSPHSYRMSKTRDIRNSENVGRFFSFERE